MYKKHVIIISSAVIALFIISLSIILYFIFFVSYGHVDDTNGEFTQLETINVREMIDTTNTYRADFSSHQYTGSSTDIRGQLEEDDYQHIEFKSSKFSGIKTVQATNLKNNQKLTIEIESKLTEGNLEIVIISPDNELIYTVKINAKEIVEIDNTITGIYRVVIGGESAKLNIIVDRKIEDN